MPAVSHPIMSRTLCEHSAQLLQSQWPPVVALRILTRDECKFQDLEEYQHVAASLTHDSGTVLVWQSIHLVLLNCSTVVFETDRLVGLPTDLPHHLSFTPQDMQAGGPQIWLLAQNATLLRSGRRPGRQGRGGVRRLLKPLEDWPQNGGLETRLWAIFADQTGARCTATANSVGDSHLLLAVRSYCLQDADGRLPWSSFEPP